ncbi:MAG: hypothetical protein QM773_11580 [Hyphomonadaceae bacterium]
MLKPLPLAWRLEAILRVCTDSSPRIAPLAAHMKRGRVLLVATRARPQPIRLPRTFPALNRLGAMMGLAILRQGDSSWSPATTRPDQPPGASGGDADA